MIYIYILYMLVSNLLSFYIIWFYDLWEFTLTSLTLWLWMLNRLGPKSLPRMFQSQWPCSTSDWGMGGREAVECKVWQRTRVRYFKSQVEFCFCNDIWRFNEVQWPKGWLSWRIFCPELEPEINCAGGLFDSQGDWKDHVTRCSSLIKKNVQVNKLLATRISCEKQPAVFWSNRRQVPTTNWSLGSSKKSKGVGVAEGLREGPVVSEMESFIWTTKQFRQQESRFFILFKLSRHQQKAAFIMVLSKLFMIPGMMPSEFVFLKPWTTCIGLTRSEPLNDTTDRKVFMPSSMWTKKMRRFWKMQSSREVPFRKTCWEILNGHSSAQCDASGNPSDRCRAMKI